MPEQKNIPMRRCTGCMQSLPKKELVRIVRTPDGTISLDITGKKSGRGAYICKNPACLSKARKARRLEKNLDCIIPDEIYVKLEEEFAANE
jgi:predicted RNA-binding protein YlxR (DUF448 family)